jgi:hypothetical protein
MAVMAGVRTLSRLTSANFSLEKYKGFLPPQKGLRLVKIAYKHIGGTLEREKFFPK